MVRKKLDTRVRTLIERSVSLNQRSLLILVGDRGKDQVPNLHHLLTKTSVRPRRNVLWCYKKELGFSTHRTKRMKKIKRDQAKGLKSNNTPLDASSVDNFELFLTSCNIQWCYYKDTPRILGNTFSMLILSDFEALTPNILARTVETVEGGGLVVLLLRSVTSLKQLYAMSMDVHARYRTDSSRGDVVPRFCERFILSLGVCRNCLVCDDELNVLPISKESLKESLEEVRKEEGSGEVLLCRTKEDVELESLKEELRETPNVGVIVELAKTLDQAKAVLTFLEACSEKKCGQTVALTAARGRGKSAAIGLCLAGAISFRYSTILVTAPEPENLVSVFEFVLLGLEALKYEEHIDYTVTYDSAMGKEKTKCVVCVDVHREHRQMIKYVRPNETDKFASAELVAIDEAAAIPLPTVRALVSKDRLTFLSSTVNGYEGTGRALSLKLLKELRDDTRGALDAASKASGAIEGARSKKKDAKLHERRWAAASSAAAAVSPGDRLREIELETPIRYAVGDAVESWLNSLLCLDCGSASNLKLKSTIPSPTDCDLYHVDRDALFSHHKLSEQFLQKIMGLYTSAHYKNQPNDLQMLSDAPAHSLFVLLNSKEEQQQQTTKKGLPDILAVIQVALEGQISRKTIEAQLSRGHRSAGDLIPWTISQQFGDSNFGQLSGARIVRVAVHPNLQGMGYGTRSVELLGRFYNGEMVSLDAEEEESSSGDDDAEEEEEESASDAESEDDESKKPGILTETLRPQKKLPPLLQPLTSLTAPQLDWIGTSFGLTPQLHRFWNKSGFQLLYLRQTRNELTGEYSSIYLKSLPNRSGFDDAWLPAFRADARRRIASLLSGPFRTMEVKLAIDILDNDSTETSPKDERTLREIRMRSGGGPSPTLSATELNYLLTPHDLKRLELYGRNLCDHHLITDLVPSISRMYFSKTLPCQFSKVQSALVCGIGLQYKTIDELSDELGLPPTQVLAMFNKAVKKMSIALNGVVEESVKREEVLSEEKRRNAEETMMEKVKDVTRKTLRQEEGVGVTKVMETLQETSASLPPQISKSIDIMQYAIKGTEEDWNKALQKNDSTEIETVQIKSLQTKRKHTKGVEEYLKEESGEKKGKKKKKKKILNRG